jgi:hypothetical protein
MWGPTALVAKADNQHDVQLKHNVWEMTFVIIGKDNWLLFWIFQAVRLRKGKAERLISRSLEVGEYTT